jgi:hypothetical protein
MQARCAILFLKKSNSSAESAHLVSLKITTRSATMATYKAVKYIRLSYADKHDADGRDESNSVTNQRNILDRFIANQPDIEAVDEKIDDGISGLIFDRPAFKEMMADIEAGLVNCVVVKDAEVK